MKDHFELKETNIDGQLLLNSQDDEIHGRVHFETKEIDNNHKDHQE